MRDALEYNGPPERWFEVRQWTDTQPTSAAAAAAASVTATVATRCAVRPTSWRRSGSSGFEVRTSFEADYFRSVAWIGAACRGGFVDSGG